MLYEAIKTNLYAHRFKTRNIEGQQCLSLKLSDKSELMISGLQANSRRLINPVVSLWTYEGKLEKEELFRTKSIKQLRLWIENFVNEFNGLKNDI